MIPTANDELALIKDPVARARCEALREVVDELDALISKQRVVAQLPYVRGRASRGETLLGDLQAACAEEKLKGLIEAAELAMTKYTRAVEAARAQIPTNGESNAQAGRHQVEQLPDV